MVCLSRTLALIIFAIPLLVTVISAFRVRLPGVSHELKSESRRHKCKDCDVSDLNLDPITHNIKKESVKGSYDDIEKIQKDKRHLIEEKLSETSFNHYNVTEGENEDNDNDVSEESLDESKFKSVDLSSNLHLKSRSKKASVILDFDDDDDDSDIENDDEYDDYSKKDSKKSGSAESKKIVKPIEHLHKDVKATPKPKAVVTEKVDIQFDDKHDVSKIKVATTVPKIEPKKKVDVLPQKEILKESLKSKDELLKPLKQEVKDNIHKEEDKKNSKSSAQSKPTNEEKTKDFSSKESFIVKSEGPKLGLKAKEDLIDKEKIRSKKADVKITTQKLKENQAIISGTDEKAEIMEKIKINIETKHPKHFEELKVDKQESVTKSDSKEARVQHLSDALVRRNLLQSEFEDFYAFFPTFAPNFSRIHNPECRRHGQILLRQLRGTKIWALNSKYIIIVKIIIVHCYTRTLNTKKCK